MACKEKVDLTPEKKAAIQVKTALVLEHDIKEYLVFNGVTKYQKQENIRANVTGYITQIPFKIGDPIRKGQAFAYVRTKEQDAIREAVKIDSSLAKFTSPTQIFSNASGVLSSLNVAKNDYIAEGDTLATITQSNSLSILANIPFEYTNVIKIGTPCEILLPNSDTIRTKISGFLPKVDRNVQAQTFLIDLPNENLPENLNVQVQFVQKEASKVMSVPKQALQTNELLTDFWVMKIVNDTLAIKQKVTPLLQNDSLVQIASTNLKLNDKIVTSGGYQMQDSTLVSINN